LVSGAKTRGELIWGHGFLESRANIGLSPTAHMLFFHHVGAKPTWVVAFDDWVGKTAHLYVASDGRTPIPRSLAYFTMLYGFEHIHLQRLFSLTNSLNRRVHRLMGWLGFREIYRAAGCHEGGGDLVFNEITHSDVQHQRYFQNGQEIYPHAA